MKRLCLITAAGLEYRAAASILAASTSRQRGVTLFKTGIGANFTAEISPRLYDAVLVAGLAGGLDLTLSAGDALVYDRCRDGRDEGARALACDTRWSETICEAVSAAGLRARRATGVTAGRIVVEAEAKLALGALTLAAAVDMESYDLIAACGSVPVAVLRVIADEARDDLPDFNRALEAGGEINARRAALVMAARPLAARRFLARLRTAHRAFRIALAAALDAAR
jgi:nucleoside phosphorylase